MPPTIQTNLNTDRDKRPPRTGEKRSELVCKVKYCNTLPDIPFDPKFITYPFESRRFIEYNPTSLERNYKYEVLTEHDLGVTIDLINKDLYTTDFRATLDPADEKLLEEDILTQTDSKRSRHHGMSVSWLRRTEYISTEQTRFQPQTMDKVEAKVGYSIKKNLKDETLFLDRENQIRAIEKTFADSKQPIEKHYSKPNVVPVEISPVFPDFKLWKYPCAQVIFDSDPAPVGRPVPAQIEEMSQAMIRGVMDESGEQFVAYFLPTETTLEKRRADFTNGVDYVDEEEYEYKMAREYNWNVKSKASKGYEENYFLVMRPDGVYYNELETRVRLSKRRQKAGQQVNNTRLVVRHRVLNASEFKMQRYREKLLEPPNEEDEEEEEEEEEEEQPQEQLRGNKSDDEDKANSEKGQESGSDKEDSDREESRRRIESDKEGDESDKEIDEVDKGKPDSNNVKEKNINEKGESEKEESDAERHDSDHEGDIKSRKSHDSDGARSRSSSESRSGSENEAETENKNEEAGDKTDAASHSSGSRSRSSSGSRRSRSRSQSVRRSRSRSQSVRRSRSRSQSARQSRSRSPSERQSRSRSPSVRQSRSRSPSVQQSRSPSSIARQSRSRSPSVRQSRSRSPSAQRSRSPSPQEARSRSASHSPSGSRSSTGSAGGSASDSE